MKKKFFTRIVFVSLLLLFGSWSGYSQVYFSPDSVRCGATSDTIRGNLVASVPVASGITDDDIYTASAIDLGFEFKFYDTYYTQCLIGANGMICFDLSLAGAYNPWPISAVLLDNSSAFNSVCGPWCDMYVPAGGAIKYATVGTAPYRRFEVTFCHVAMFSCTSQWTTSQIILYETTNIVEVHVGHKTICSSWNGGYAIIGVQNASGSSATVAPGRDYPDDWSTHDEAWRFTGSDTTISGYTVDTIPYCPIPIASSTASIYWYDSSTGALLGTGPSIDFTPSYGDSVVYAWAFGCDDTTITKFTLNMELLGAGGSPVHITSFDTTNPTLCGYSNGTVTLTGVNPGFVDTVFYSYAGVEQPYILDSATVVTGAGGITDTLMTISGLCAGTYDYFYVKQGPCPSNSVGPIVLRNPPVTVTDTSHTNTGCSVCDGTFTLYGLPAGQSVAVSYNYNGAPQTPFSGTTTASGTITVSDLCEGNYDNIVASLNACSPGACASTPRGTIVVLPPPLIEIRLTGSSGPTSCGACDGTITITGMAPGSIDSIFYTLNGVPQVAVYSANPDSSITLYSLCAGAYSNFSASVALCPTNVITSTITLVDPVIVPSFSDAILYGCNGDTVTFTNSSTTTGSLWYIWHFGDGTTDTATNPSHIYGQGSYNITLIATDHHCVDSTSASVSLVNPIQAVFAASGTEICQSTPITFTNSSVGTPPTYLWSFGDGTTDTVANPSHTFKNVGTYTVKLVATNFVPCSDSATATVVVDSQSVMSLAISDSVLCAGTYITLNGTYTGIGNTGVTWMLGNGDSIKNVNPLSYAFDIPGSYTVSATASYKACLPVTVSRTLNVYSEPNINIGNDTSICLGGQAGIVLSDNVNAGNPAATWLWSTGETTSSIGINTAGCYYASVTIHGCQASDSVCISNSCYIPIPNVFSPNGDGVNDYFCPRNSTTMSLSSFKMDIYNRWGQLIFETEAIDGKGWDGKFNEMDQPEGVYIYVIDATFKDGGKEHQTGNLTLLR